MSWPTPQEYNEAIQTPLFSFSDPELQKGEIALTPIGIPKAMTGAFASVYKITSDNTSWAVRCLLTERPDQKERYEKISRYVLMDNLEYTTSFHYLEEGIKVRGKWYPIVKMNWVDGPTFENYILTNFNNKEKILNLKEQFTGLAKGLDDAGMAHGDLQHGNMIVSSQGLKLIDYDAIFVPELQGKVSLELGHPNYQHPLRTEHHYDTTVDNFSCWLIDFSLLFLSIDPALFEKFSGGDECILFRRQDLKSPETSALFQALLNHEAAIIREKTGIIIRMLWSRPELIPELHEEHELSLLPDIKPESIPVPDKENLYHIDTVSETKKVTIDTLYSETKFHQDQNISWSTTDQTDTTSFKDKLAKSGFKEAVRSYLTDIAQRSQELFLPDMWINKNTAMADTIFNNGDYEKAIPVYLESFKKLHEYKEDPYSREGLIDVSLKLGYTLTLVDNINLATNYFLTAFKIVRRYFDKNAPLIARSAFLLACNRATRGDIEDGLQIFREEELVYPYLDETIKNEPYKEVIEKPEVLAMLLELPQVVEISGNTRRSRDFSNLCLQLHESIKAKTSTHLDKRCAEIQLSLAFYDYQYKRYDTSMKNVDKFLAIIDLILEKENKTFDQEKMIPNYFLNMVSTTKLDNLKSSYPGLIQFINKVINQGLIQSEDDMIQLFSTLETIDYDETFYCLKEYFSKNQDKVKYLPNLIQYCFQTDFINTHSVLETILLNYGSDSNISGYKNFLKSNQFDSILESFEIYEKVNINPTDLLASVKPSYTSSASDDSLNENDLFENEFFERTITLLKWAKSPNLINSLTNLVYKQFRSLNTNLSLPLLMGLVKDGEIEILKTILSNHPDLLSIISGKTSTTSDIILIALLYLQVYGDERVEEFIEEIESQQLNFNFFKFIVDASKLSIVGTGRVILLTVRSFDSNEKVKLISSLARNKEFSTMNVILYLLTEDKDKDSLNELHKSIVGSHHLVRVDSPCESIDMKDYILITCKTSIALIEKGAEIDSAIWVEELKAVLQKEAKGKPVNILWS